MRSVLQAFGALLAVTVVGKLALHHRHGDPRSQAPPRLRHIEAGTGAAAGASSRLQAVSGAASAVDAALIQMRAEAAKLPPRAEQPGEPRGQAAAPGRRAPEPYHLAARHAPANPVDLSLGGRSASAGLAFGGDSPSGEAAPRGRSHASASAAPQALLAGDPEYVWVFHNSDGGYKYNHMATSEVLPDGTLVVAWQRAHAAEGLNDQEIVWSTSADGGHTWSEPQVVPGRQSGIMWTPSLFRPPGGKLHLFFTESHGCWWCESPQCFKAHCRAGAANCDVTVPFGSIKLNLAKLAREPGRRRLQTSRGAPKDSKTLAKPGGGVASITWRAGGDLKLVTAEVAADGLRWGAPRGVLSEQADGPVPKVIANPPIVDPRTGHWVLPFWRETPRGEVVCPTKAPGGDYASVLISQDEGLSWRTGDEIKMPNPWKNLTKPDWLIEGSVAPSRDGSVLLQAFRTAREKAYIARSADGGATWLPAEATPLRNPNAKMNLLRLSNGVLAAAYNAHGSEQYKRRSLMTVSVSADDGRSWKDLALLETRLEQELRFHYPMLRQLGCQLLLTYSVMVPPKTQERGGIRLVKLPICFGPGDAECPCA